MTEAIGFQFSITTTLLMLVGFYGLSFIMTLFISRRNETADGYMTSNNNIGFGFSAASMTATWIWAASFYASATSGYQYGLSGAIHYGFWGALMILFIYPFGRRFREVAPKAHTLAEIMHARHGSSSQMILALSNLVGSGISLMVNFTAAGALVSILTPLSFTQGVLIAAAGVLSYTLWSGFRASVLTDFAQLVAMIIAAVVIIPLIFFNLGGVELVSENFANLSEQQADFFSSDALLHQGLPFFVAVLAYAIGNQTIAQRLFAVREDLIKPTFITATIGYASIVIGLGMLGFIALLAGLQPIDGDMNNIIPQMAASYLPPFAIAMFFILVIGSLSSTADSDLSALSAIMMADVYGKNIARGRPNPKTMLLLGRITMIVATAIGVVFASLRLDILVMLVFVGALWGAIVFPVISSFYWERVTNAAFSTSVLVALVLFSTARFELLAMTGVVGVSFEILASVGGGVVIGLMTFAFFPRQFAIAASILTTLVLIPICVGSLRDYTVLLSSLTAYGASTVVCVAMSLMSDHRFDFSSLARRVTAYDERSEDEDAPSAVKPAAV